VTTDDRDGATRIADERRRVLESEGFDLAHDLSYKRGELVYAGLSYLKEAVDMDGIFSWPFPTEWWKPSDDPVRNLEKAGQFIAAEIDRILAARAEERSSGPMHAFVGYDANPGICRVCGGVQVMPGVSSCHRVRGVDA